MKKPMAYGKLRDLVQLATELQATSIGFTVHELSEKMDGYTEVTYLNVGEVGETTGDQEVDIEASSVGIFTGVRFRF